MSQGQDIGNLRKVNFKGNQALTKEVRSQRFYVKAQCWRRRDGTGDALVYKLHFWTAV